MVGPLFTTQRCFPDWFLMSFSPRLRNWEAPPSYPVHAVPGGEDMTVYREPPFEGAGPAQLPCFIGWDGKQGSAW